MSPKRLTKVKISGFKMFNIKMPQLTIGDAVARIPIVQGGMGVGISLAGLASAVANAGGIGVIAAVGLGLLEPDYFTNGKEANKRALRKQIRKARSMTDGLIGVNILVAVSDFHQLLMVAIEENVDIVFMGAGLPLKGIPVRELREAGVKVVPIVSSARAARLIFTYWKKNYGTVPDAVVVEGPKAGGHLGFKETQIDDPAFALENLVPGVVKEIKPFESDFDRSIPVIAAGGIYDGEDIYRFFELGAGGVQMATRFVATHECDADQKFKESYVSCEKDDIAIIKSPVGLPGRAIKNSYLMEAESGGRKVRCPWRCLAHCGARDAHYCIAEALNNARKGKLSGGFAFAGANAYRVKEIVHVDELLHQLKLEYIKMVKYETVNLRHEFEEAFKNLKALKHQYVKTAKKSVKNLKSELDELLDRGHTAFLDEFKHVMERLDELRDEYAGHFDRVNQLKEELSRFFDTSALKLPTAVIS